MEKPQTFKRIVGREVVEFLVSDPDKRYLPARNLNIGAKAFAYAERLNDVIPMNTEEFNLTVKLFTEALSE